MNLSDESRYFNERQDAMIEMIREIVEIESPSRDPERSRQVLSRFRTLVRAIPPFSYPPISLKSSKKFQEKIWEKFCVRFSWQ